MRASLSDNQLPQQPLLRLVILTCAMLPCFSSVHLTVRSVHLFSFFFERITLRVLRSHAPLTMFHRVCKNWAKRLRNRIRHPSLHQRHNVSFASKRTSHCVAHTNLSIVVTVGKRTVPIAHSKMPIRIKLHWLTVIVSHMLKQKIAQSLSTSLVSTPLFQGTVLCVHHSAIYLNLNKQTMCLSMEKPILVCEMDSENEDFTQRRQGRVDTSELCEDCAEVVLPYEPDEKESIAVERPHRVMTDAQFYSFVMSLTDHVSLYCKLYNPRYHERETNRTYDLVQDHEEYRTEILRAPFRRCFAFCKTLLSKFSLLTETVTLEPITPDRVSELRNLNKNLRNEQTDRFYAYVRDTCLSDPTNMRCAMHRGKMIGAVICEVKKSAPTTLRIVNIVVARGYQRSGIGSLFLKYILANSLYGAIYASIETHVKSSNVAALRFFKTFNFEVKKRILREHHRHNKYCLLLERSFELHEFFEYIQQKVTKNAFYSAVTEACLGAIAD
uniref:N-acetyltransferase domain-containing protein n=1 Tax=Steinernema glaseri TaxID=37863 RepID=A0A1I7ZX54_9BILA